MTRPISYSSLPRPGFRPYTLFAFSLACLTFVTYAFCAVWIILWGPMPAWAAYTWPITFFGPILVGGLAFLASIWHFTADVRPRGTWMVLASPVLAFAGPAALVCVLLAKR